MTEVTYTVTNSSGDLLGRELSLFEAAIEVMNYDGHEYQIRQDEDGKGWTLFTSTFSRNSTAHRGLTRSTIFSLAETQVEATKDIMRQVIANADWFKHCDVQTDAAYDAMIAQIEEEQ